ncbi:hypothetical protein N7517_002389 [Penicillium concentricum]|uniref:Uncharacterized protein n=1 Tax=Penicillium concentricum TaxID=293559 RepID=A0A9W9SXD8_9EURO|nr:uncharacterized protein N7517_002389 [Penicillium concentricum]KAJ5384478.1 hypothetical protein N7517_002389 [Penicillium concentricum]
MSFGWSSGDIIASLSFSREVYDALTSSTEEYQDFKSFLRTLDANLDLILSWTTPDNGNENPRFTADEANILNEVIMNLQKSVLRFESALKKYMRLDQKPSSMPIIDQMKRQGDKLRWHFLTETDVKKRKEEVMGYLTQLNTVSHNHNM